MVITKPQGKRALIEFSILILIKFVEMLFINGTLRIKKI